jgi:hypothetical protein
MKDNDRIKGEILAALDHPEAEDGLYFRNFYHLHEEDEREPVKGSQEQILEALRELIDEGQVATDETGDEVIFRRRLPD